MNVSKTYNLNIWWNSIVNGRVACPASGGHVRSIVACSPRATHPYPIAHIGLRTLAVIALFILGLVKLSDAGEPLVYHSERHGYSLTLPIGWERIPDNAVQQKLTNMRLQGIDTSSTSSWDAAFQPKNAVHWSGYPYVIVNVIPYTRMGLSRQINEDEFDDLINVLTRGNLASVLEQAWDEALGEKMSLDGDGKDSVNVTVDRSGHRYKIETISNVQGVGRVRSILFANLGREAHVQVQIYARDDQWSEFTSICGQIAASFRFDTSKAYDVNLASRNRGFSIKRFFKSVAFAALLGGVLGAITSLVVELLLGRKISGRVKNALIFTGVVLGYCIVKALVENK